MNQIRLLSRHSLAAFLCLVLVASSGAADLTAGKPEVVRAQALLRQSQARRLPTGERLALILEAARIAYPGMLAGRSLDTTFYETAVTRLVATLRADSFSGREVRGSAGTFHLVLDRDGGHRMDPATAAEILPAADVPLRGMKKRRTEAGVGLPMVFCYPMGSAFLRDQPGVSRAGISVPVTAVLTFDGRTARLAFYNRLDRGHIEIDGRKRKLAADFSAAISQMVSRTPNRPFDIPGLIFTRQYLKHAGLYQFQLYDRNRIPVILVHGLFSRPEAWTEVLSSLLTDPTIRRRYQFWFFLYPTGLPIWQSSQLLRDDLNRFHRELERDGQHPNLHRLILVGHSMGGLISSLMVRDPGESFWAAMSDRSLDELHLTPEAKKLIRDMVKFDPRDDIARVIYVTTPHRGSPIPHHPVIERAIRFIQMPRTFSRQDRDILVDAVREELRALFTLPANSIRFLQSGSPVLEAVETLPISGEIPYHSIIGDRGRGDTPDSSDGIVPYWSSHLDSAVSEKIIPTDHSAPQYPETADEIRRILLEAAGR